MTSIERVKERIESIIAYSSVPEDPIHSKNTLMWLIKLRPDADEALQIAALGHDIERAVESRKVRREDYESYDEFKDAHALNSAGILKEIMEECNINKEFIDDVFSLVRLHERGGDRRADLLKDADSISFFDVNLPLYLARNGAKEATKRCMWGLRRLSDDLKEIAANFCREHFRQFK